MAGRSSATVHVHDHDSTVVVLIGHCHGHCHDDGDGDGKFLLLFAIMMIVVVMSMVRLFYYLATEGGELSSATQTCVPSVHTQVSQVMDWGFMITHPLPHCSSANGSLAVANQQ